MASFHDHLIINRFLLSLFQQSGLFGFKSLADVEDEPLTDEGQTPFYELLDTAKFRSASLSSDDLCRYDTNIIEHWQKITAQRNRDEGHELKMKYFQYLSLLFTEVYLDWQFNRPDELIVALNKTLQTYNEAEAKKPKKAQKVLQAYEVQDLNKLAFWNATGSGKTLLMHVNLLQYRHYNPDKIDKTILLTPNEGLSKQHFIELQQSGISVKYFDKNSTQSDWLDSVEIIDVNKLADKDGDKTVAVEYLSGNNLVLVDEGHRGASGDKWLEYRNKLIGNGFAFEYSATFGQAVAKGKIVSEQEEDLKKQKAKYLFGKTSLRNLTEAEIEQATLNALEQQQARQTALFEVYAKSILFDYSYRFFYEDGYGKESLILNMKEEAYQEHDKLYFTACLLAFYQQVYLYQTGGERLQEWHIEAPLWIFVGSRVAQKENAQEKSDILQVVQHLAYFLNNRETVSRYLRDLVRDEAQIIDSNGNNIFQGRFTALMNIDNLYDDILHRVFHAASEQRLCLTHRKKTDGELALSVGNNEAFGVINIGDASGFYKIANSEDNHQLFDCASDDFSDGLFAGINDENSKTNLLIGSRKFTEGWSSWRVSTMGLLNMGKNEGAQIIQLFGRGIRLKGREFSLKRSTPDERQSEQAQGLHLDKLETLNIFGVRANYMEQFKNYLKEEGITPSDELLTLNFPVKTQLPPVKLKTLKLKDGYQENKINGFKRQETVTLFEIPEKWQGKIKDITATLDRYPRVESVASDVGESDQKGKRHEGKLNSAYFAFYDWNKVYLVLCEHKRKRKYSNIRLHQSALQDFAQKTDWYTLFIPESVLKIHQFGDIIKQQELLIELLCLYLDAFYNRLKSAYEGQYYETVLVDENNGSLLHEYQFTIENNDNGREYEKRLEKLKNLIAGEQLREELDWNDNGDGNITAICFKSHLYAPIFTLKNTEALPLTLKPLPMNESSEIQFVRDLQAAEKDGKLKAWIGDKELYLLRNAANKSKGLGFALAGNFYPDFLLWLVDKQSGKQWLSLIDPKGIRNMSLSDQKFGLAEEIKKLQKELNLDIELNNFILSITDKEKLINTEKISDKDYNDRHILFMSDTGYLGKMFKMII